MSVEFRQRSAGEFIEMFRRRKWLILLPIVTMTAAIGYVVYDLPSVYESKTVLTVKPPKISDRVVQSLSDSDVTQSMETISQEVLSRTSLEPMIAKYKLFEMERRAGVAQEIIIERMRNNIHVEKKKTDADKLAAFEISYRDRTPEAARNVAAELASKYISAQVGESANRARETEAFIDKEVTLKKKALDVLEKQRLDIMMQNVETLPESAQGLIAQLDGLRKREENIGQEKDSLLREKGRISDNINSLNSQMRLIVDYGVRDAKDAARRGAAIENTIPYGQLIQKRATLRARLDNLKITLRDKNPKVIKARTDIDKVEEEIANLRKNSARRAADASKISERRAKLRKENLMIDKRKAESQVSQIVSQIQAKNSELVRNGGLISILESKINTIPSVKVMLESIQQQYQSAKTAYDDLAKKKNNAQLQVNRESNAQGETIRVVDPANLPKSPVAPKRELLTLFGAAVGLALGLFLAAIFEVPRLFKIQNIEDAKHYTGLPLLAAVPPLLTPDEASWQNRSYWLKVLAGAGTAVGSIPIIILILQASRVFERVVS